MKRFGIIVIWFAVLIIDGVILPALTGLPSGFGIIVFLSALAITFGIHRWVLWFGIILAGISELILASYFGVIIGAWLVMATGWYFLNQFLSTKPMGESDSFFSFVPSVFFGFVLTGLGEGAIWLISRFVYKSGFATTTLLGIVRSPMIVGVMAVELGLILLVFRWFYSPKNSIYG